MARPRLRIGKPLWSALMSELHRRTRRRHESGAFLLGPPTEAGRLVTHVIYYDDLDANAYRTGIVILHADAFSRLWAKCAALRLQVVADVHVHAFSADQSGADRDNPMIAQKGHIALIIPRFAAPPVHLEELGMHEYVGAHFWNDLGGRSVERHLLITDDDRVA